MICWDASNPSFIVESSVIEGQCQRSSNLQQTRTVAQEVMTGQSLSSHSIRVRGHIFKLQVQRQIVYLSTSKADMITSVELEHQRQELIAKECNQVRTATMDLTEMLAESCWRINLTTANACGTELLHQHGILHESGKVPLNENAVNGKLEISGQHIGVDLEKHHIRHPNWTEYVKLGQATVLHGKLFEGQANVIESPDGRSRVAAAAKNAVEEVHQDGRQWFRGLPQCRMRAHQMQHQVRSSGVRSKATLTT